MNNHINDEGKSRSIEKSLMEEQKNFSTILNAMPVGLAILDRNLIITRVNSALASHMGISIEAMINKRIGNGVNCVNSMQDKRGCGYGDACKICSLRTLTSDVNDTGIAVYGKEIQHSLFIGGKKEDFWFKVNAVPIFINGDKHIMLFIDDITEKKKELKALKKYQLLSEKANDIIFFIDPKGNILEANETAVSTYGYSREEFQRLTLYDLRKTEYISIINEQLDAVWTRSIMIHTTHFRKDGTSFPVEASWSGAEIGSVRVILCVARDITERKQFQTNLENRNKELHDVVDKLKRTQSQLVQQEQFAAIGILAAGVAHEINNPLGFIISNLATLEKYGSRLKEVIAQCDGLKEAIAGSDIEEFKRVLAEIDELKKRYRVDFIIDDMKALLDDTNDGLHRISKIVMGLRVFSRIDHQDELTNYDFNEGVENSIMVANNEIKYYADIEKNFGEIPLVTLPSNQINQVLLNLIINAVHAIRGREDGQRGIIKISTYEADNYVCCDVEDNGIGISEENLNMIFNPFFTTKPVGQGTGLGLSISYDVIVNKYGGEMIVKSTPGKGTVFTVKLPLEQ